ncbi:hypothetical protein M2161_009280 [Streptomyces sp. SAI-133]|nr:hypothetical protein [Streptomyces sp. SAI-133]
MPATIPGHLLVTRPDAELTASPGGSGSRITLHRTSVGDGSSDDEQLLRGRIYGADHDHPGPKPGRRYAELVGGPLDGLLLDITGWRPEEIDDGVSLATELGQFGPGGRALYDPRPGDPARWDWGGDSP